ncbi:hypothetical protein [Micromonospora sp. NBRC 101691]|uniref:hypothetical protein n=1 Tax=Micromonospora sp. NBRC 101691 TaxID=3032198 RepID=UPI0024A41925|nr:hypothetical protein [Micromonospora sp. NBRC 101691]GLY25698.1 hypothetical protein Misp04_54290 [Micromonospora sp. NBRC 101691]
MRLSREEALLLANEPVTAWANADVEYEPRSAVDVFQLRLGPADGMWVAREADRRCVNPSMVIEARRAVEGSPADQDASDEPGSEG